LVQAFAELFRIVDDQTGIGRGEQVEQLLVPYLRKAEGQTIARWHQAELAQAQCQLKFAALAVAVQGGGTFVIVHAGLVLQ